MTIDVNSAAGVLVTGRRYVNSVLEPGTSKANVYWYVYDVARDRTCDIFELNVDHSCFNR